MAIVGSYHYILYFIVLYTRALYISSFLFLPIEDILYIFFILRKARYYKILIVGGDNAHDYRLTWLFAQGA